MGHDVLADQLVNQDMVAVRPQGAFQLGLSDEEAVHGLQHDVYCGRPRRVPILSPSAVVPTPGGGAAPCASGEVFPFRSCSNCSRSLASTSVVAGSGRGFVCWAFGFAFRGGVRVELFRGGFPAGFVLVGGRPPALLGPGNGNVNSKVRPTARRGGVCKDLPIGVHNGNGSSPPVRGLRGAGFDPESRNRFIPAPAGCGPSSDQLGVLHRFTPAGAGQMVFVLEVQHILWRPRVCGVSVPPGAPRRGAQPRGAHLMLGEVAALRPAARTGEKGAAPGEPAGGPQDACFRSGDRFPALLDGRCGEFRLEARMTALRASGAISGEGISGSRV